MMTAAFLSRNTITVCGKKMTRSIERPAKISWLIRRSLVRAQVGEPGIKGLCREAWPFVFETERDTGFTAFAGLGPGSSPGRGSQKLQGVTSGFREDSNDQVMCVSAQT